MSALYMFPPNEAPMEDVDLSAGEYALGVLDSGEAAAIRLRAEAEPALRAAIARWQSRLAYLTAMLPLSELPASSWERIAAEIGAHLPAPTLRQSPEPEPLPPQDAEADTLAGLTQEEVLPPSPIALPEPVPMVVPPVPVVQPPQAVFVEPPPAAPRQPPPPSEGGIFATLAELVPLAQDTAAKAVPHVQMTTLRRWQFATAAALGLAVALAVLQVMPTTHPVRSIAAIGPVSAPAPLFLAETDGAGRLTILPLATIAVPPGRDLELWTLPPNAAPTLRPISLGVMPAGGRVLSLDAPPPEGTQLLVSMEPRGGSASGQISGQVLYGGVLANH